MPTADADTNENQATTAVLITMKYSLMKRLLGAAMALTFSLALNAQIVTSGVTGIIRDPSGRPVAGAKIKLTHVPTGLVYETTTNASGRYNVGGMVVGGPYQAQVDAAGFKPTERTDVMTVLGSDIDVGFSLQATDVVVMERFTVAGETTELDSSVSGAGSILDSMRLETKPTTQRSLADLISASPLVTMRAANIGDREESQIVAVGQNNRYNAILIDGARINDQFGLNMTGLASFFNPLSVDTIEQLSVQVSPYDVKLAGFTGASINAVTKSGTNRFKGSAYYIWGGDELMGFQMQGPDTATLINTGRKVVPKLERNTKGFTLGGPIWKNHVFFFVNYEKFERIAVPASASLLTVNADDMTNFISQLGRYNTASGKNISWGESLVGTTISNITKEEKKLAKVDWNINSDHRVSVRWSTTEGALPQFGKYQSFAISDVTGLTTSGSTALSTHIYSQERPEEVWAGQVFSRWTPNFRTEVKYSQVSQDQETPLSVVAPEVAVFGLRGTDRNGVPITDASFVAGTEFSRHGNSLSIDSKNYSVTGDYTWNNFTFSGGFEREESDFFNIFRSGSFGTVIFRNMADFIADLPVRIARPSYDPARRGSAGEPSAFATNGYFVQAKWDVSSRLNLTAGLRYEVPEVDEAPRLNTQFLADTGFNNTGTIDGSKTISPRFGFNLGVDDERHIQVRGGFGHFLGKAPWVLFSNSYGRTGIGDFTVINDAPAGGTLAQGSFTNYLRAFDPANPIGQGTDNPALQREVNWADADIELPSVWRGNLAADIRLPVLSSVLTFEVVRTINDKQFFITNENLRATTIGADGRQRFAGNPSTLANRKYAGYTDLYRLRNVGTGDSTYISIGIDRPMKNKWSANLSYTHGEAKDSQSFGQTTASGQWQRNVVFNQSQVETSRSDFEIKHRVQLSLARQFEPVKNWKSVVSLYYEGRSGDPFSWVYAQDLNGDGQTTNDLVAVPSGVNDPRFDFSTMNAATQALYFQALQTTGLNAYAGGVAPKNGFFTPFSSRLDLRFSQTIPLYKPAELEIFMDFVNIGALIDEDLFGGYFIEANQKHFGSEMFRRNRLGGAAYGPDGRIRPAYTAFDNFVYENGQSRWKIQLGARLRF